MKYLKTAKVLVFGVWGLFLFSCTDLNFKTGSGEARQLGEVLDSLDGVYVYYNGSVSNVSGRNTAADGYNLGLKYQCVEFVKRYYYQALKHKMTDSYGHAKSFFMPAIADGKLNTMRNLFQYTNGSISKPKKGDLLVFDGTVFNEYGHVAIVSWVGEDELEMIQQNPGPSAPSREKLGMVKEGNRWRIKSSTLLGWLRKSDA